METSGGIEDFSSTSIDDSDISDEDDLWFQIKQTIMFIVIVYIN